MMMMNESNKSTVGYTGDSSYLHKLKFKIFSLVQWPWPGDEGEQRSAWLELTPELGKVEPVIPHAATQPGEGHSATTSCESCNAAPNVDLDSELTHCCDPCTVNSNFSWPCNLPDAWHRGRQLRGRWGRRPVGKTIVERCPIADHSRDSAPDVEKV